MEKIQDDEDKKSEEPKSNQWIFRIVILVIVVIAIVIAAIYKTEILKILESFLDWVKEHQVLGPILLVLLYIVCVVLFFPGSILTLGAGLALKQAYQSTWKATLVGSLAVWIGASIGATLAMLLGRFVFKE